MTFKFSEHFRQNFPLRTTGVTEHEDFKIFWDRLPPDPLAACLFRIHMIPQWLKNFLGDGRSKCDIFQYLATGT